MKYLSFLLMLLLPWLAAAQEDYYQPGKQPTPTKRTYRFVLKDGTQLRGELERQDSAEAPTHRIEHENHFDIYSLWQLSSPNR